jgi:Tol biopolymer transport system component
MMNNWLTIGAAALALALIGLAIFSANAKAPDRVQPSATVTGTPKAAVVSGSANKRTATLPATRTHQANTEIPAAPVEATATEELLTTSAPALTAPTPQGGSKRIAFASDRSGSVQVWIMDIDNPENRHQVTNASGGACQPTWSPDGKRIAFTTPCKGPSIYYSGGTLKIIQLADSTITDLPVKTPGIGGAFDPAWSPDGETLLYTAVLGEKTEIRAINLMNLEVSILANQGTKNAQPAWSRDGKFISYIFNNDQNWEALWYMRPNGESKELLARSERFSEPTWAPDGLHILASMNKGNNIPVLASIDRSEPLSGAEQLLSGAYRMTHASISPDGQWVVFTSEKGSEKPEIMLASVDGKVINALTSNSLRDFHPTWSPK